MCVEKYLKQYEQQPGQVSPELIKTFPTKYTPVFKVAFTRRNLLLAAGPYQGAKQATGTLSVESSQLTTTVESNRMVQ
jgi:hypothetical protein